MIQDWIDTVVEVWRIDIGDFKQVKSPYIFKEQQFPAAISPADDFPIALTFLASTQPVYSKGYKKITWYGQTEFHITPDLKKSHNPELMLWPSRILLAAAAKVQLSGSGADISNFVILDQRDGIDGPVALKYGDEAAHWGFVVNWKVDESLAGSALPVSG